MRALHKHPRAYLYINVQPEQVFDRVPVHGMSGELDSDVFVRAGSLTPGSKS